MALADPTPAAITVAVVGAERGVWTRVFDVVRVTASAATLRAPLLLEVGERLTLRVSRGERSVDVGARPVQRRAQGDDHAGPTTDVAFDDGAAARLSPLVSA
ncbi:MAG: hypothetical protein HS111_17625 [Kofleriaceae bacterium]|nr:hypothetical protein [Kofleriaceae bacterium]